MNRMIQWSLALVASCIPALAWAQAAPPAAGAMPAGNYASICLDPSAAGISAVNYAADLLKAAGPDQAITFFTGLLGDTKNYSVQRMIRFQLADLYKQSGQPDKAVEVLKDLIELTPPEPAPSTQTIQIVPAETTPSSAPQPQQ
jgi:tetratricopeptide (TPR) repeat protein